MTSSPPALRVVADPGPAPRARPSLEDVVLLAFLLAIHALPLVGALRGGSWGAATLGYACAVVVVGGRELARELLELARGR